MDIVGLYLIFTELFVCYLPVISLSGRIDASVDESTSYDRSAVKDIGANRYNTVQ